MKKDRKKISLDNVPMSPDKLQSRLRIIGKSKVSLPGSNGFY